MPLIECPQCHHRVSSVASACPECGAPVAERLWDEMRRGEFYRCGKCREPVAVHASVCRNCGVPDPERKRLRVPPRFAVGIGVAAALLVTAVSSSERPSRPVPNPIATRTDTAPGAIDTAVAVDSAQPRRVIEDQPATTPAQPRIRPTQRPPRDPMRAGQIRWANTWVNVRSGRGMSYPVVATLNPDDMVVVDSLNAGWWVVFADGERLGYVANSVLRRTQAGPSSP